MHVRESEVLVKDIKSNELIVGRAECSLDYHRNSLITLSVLPMRAEFRWVHQLLLLFAYIDWR